MAREDWRAGLASQLDAVKIGGGVVGGLNETREHIEVNRVGQWDERVIVDSQWGRERVVSSSVHVSGVQDNCAIGERESRTPMGPCRTETGPYTSAWRLRYFQLWRAATCDRFPTSQT